MEQFKNILMLVKKKKMSQEIMLVKNKKTLTVL